MKPQMNTDRRRYKIQDQDTGCRIQDAAGY
ncbi:MAG: hypothetical protein QG641_1073 [Candidatus Poribacteria bacterium]|nr:hypothetical protein [Candidatus Poribacteria bacterium]